MTNEEILTKVENIISNGNYDIEYLLNSVPKELVYEVARMIKKDLDRKKQKIKAINKRR